MNDKVIPGPGFGNADEPGHVECFVQLNESDVKACHFGSKKADAPRVALVGDSHAYQYLNVMIALADENGWSLTTYLKGACPWNTAFAGGPSVAFTNSCAQWKTNFKSELEKQPKYDAIFAGSLADTPYPNSTAAEVSQGYIAAWKEAKGAPIVTLVDNPDFAVDPNKCLRLRSPAECTERRADVLKKVDPIEAAAESAGAILLDFTDKYCDATKCFSVVGGANVYRDQDHLTVTWTLTLKPAIGDAITRALAQR